MKYMPLIYTDGNALADSEHEKCYVSLRSSVTICKRAGNTCRPARCSRSR
jgi:hypothetical protein